jgi:hypothetical protein
VCSSSDHNQFPEKKLMWSENKIYLSWEKPHQKKWYLIKLNQQSPLECCALILNSINILLVLKSFFFLWCYSQNFGLGLPPWNSLFHFGLLDLRHSVALLGRVISSSQGLYLYTNTEKRTYTHKHQTSMPWVGFKPMIPASEQAKTLHAVDCSATVITQS